MVCVCVTKWCVKDGVVKDGVRQSGVRKPVTVCGRWCERCCVKDGVSKLVCGRWCVKDCVVKDGV